MTDHMETLYDLDIVAADTRAHGRTWSSSRAPVPNDDAGRRRRPGELVAGLL